MGPFSIYIGYDSRETAGFAVCVQSIRQHLTQPVPIHGIVLQELQAAGVYKRPMERRGGQLWDVVSDAPCSTEFAVSRFFTPHLARKAQNGGWALFMDCDMLLRANLMELFELADPKYAVMCVKHDYRPRAKLKMDEQQQTSYPRKNWSSVCLFNLEHPANDALTLDYLNSTAGRDLHGFKWLPDDLIGGTAGRMELARRP